MAKSKSPGNFCVFCLKSINAKSLPNLNFDNGDKVSLDGELKTIFIVHKLLDLDQVVTADLLQKYGNPSCWIRICWACQNMVAEAKSIYNRINKLQHSLNTLGEDARKKIKNSHFNGNRNTGKITGATLEIRNAIIHAGYSNYESRNCKETKIPGDLVKIQEDTVLQHDFTDSQVEEVVDLGDNDEDPPYSPLFIDDDKDENYTPKKSVLKNTPKKRRRNEIVRSNKSIASGNHEERLRKQAKNEENKNDTEELNDSPRKRKVPAKKQPVSTTGPLEIEQCPYCTYRCKKSKQCYFNEHMFRIHFEKMCRDKKERSEDVSITCSKCLGSSFESADALISHRLDFHNMVKCDICDHTTFGKGYLDRHVKKYHSEDTAANWIRRINHQEKMDQKLVKGFQKSDEVPTYKCKHCEITFENRDLLRTHTIEDHEDKLLKCDYEDCPDPSLRFIYLAKLYAHKVEVHKEPNDPYKCRFCNYTSRHYYQVNQHVKAMHLKREKFLCEVCSKEYSAEKSLTWHKIKYHSQDVENGEKVALLQCKFPDCGRSFNNPYYLLRHHRVFHLKTSHYKCTYDNCEGSFAGQKQLDHHIKVVHDKRHDFPCLAEGCPRSFGARHSRERHMKLYHGHKSYKCPHCQYVTSNDEWLKVHINAHERKGQSAFSCNLCGKGFPRFRTLLSHSDAHIKNGEMKRSERPSYREYKWKLLSGQD